MRTFGASYLSSLVSKNEELLVFDTLELVLGLKDEFLESGRKSRNTTAISIFGLHNTYIHELHINH